MMIKQIIKQLAMSLLLFFCTVTKVLAQEQAKFPLRIGDKMPEIIFHTMVNYPRGEAKLSDFAGKPVILDLWHVQCNACIAGMPKMQELQRKFGDKIQIIALGLNNLSDYKKLKRRSPVLRDITSLPLTLQADTPLFKNLVGVYPTHIWIDAAGIIQAITGGTNATEKHVKDFIDGKSLRFINQKPKNQLNAYYPSDTSILVQGNSKNLKILQYHSLFSGRVDFNNSGVGTSSGNYFNLGPKKPGLRRINWKLKDLIIDAWYSKGIFDRKVVLETEDLKKKFLVPNNDDEYDQWYNDNTYCYELSLPEGKAYSKEAVNEYYRQDIQRFFGVKIELKPLQTSCLVLYRLDDKDRVRTKGTPQDKVYDSGMTYGIDRKNVPMKSIAQLIETRLSWRQEPVKVIDETNYNFNVDMKFDHKLDNINLVRASLKKYGLGLKEEQRVVDCIVISKAD